MKHATGVMRMFKLVLCLLAAASVAACEQPLPSHRVEFVSRARTRVGDPVRIGGGLRVGDGVVYETGARFNETNRATAPKQELVGVLIQARVECAEVEPDGAALFRVLLRRVSFKAPPHVETPQPVNPIGFLAHFSLSPSGRIESAKLDPSGFSTGNVPVWERYGGNLRSDYMLFLSLPIAGLRVGEAIDIRDALTDEALTGLSDSSFGAQAELVGEIVLDGITELDGRRVARLLLTVAWNMSSAGTLEGDAWEIESGTTIEATLHREIRTGLPIGESRARVRGAGSVRVAGDEDHWATDVTLTGSAQFFEG